MTAAVVLAAGASRRFGRPKALLEVGGRSLLRHTVCCAVDGGCAPVAVVLGGDREPLERELRDLDVAIQVNDDWREGIAASIRVGIRGLAGSDAALLLVCDQPLLTPGIVRRLRETCEASGRITACAYSGTVGVPAVFPAQLFPELLELRGDRGAKDLLLRHAARVRRLDWPDGAVDIDRPEDYNRRGGQP